VACVPEQHAHGHTPVRQNMQSSSDAASGIPPYLGPKGLRGGSLPSRARSCGGGGLVSGQGDPLLHHTLQARGDNRADYAISAPRPPAPSPPPARGGLTSHEVVEEDLRGWEEVRVEG
jgi:hypothetical protein